MNYEIFEQVSNRMNRRNVHILMEILDQESCGIVPLVHEDQVSQVKRITDANGLAVFLFNKDIHAVEYDIVPPKDMSKKAFLELARDLNFSLQEEMTININEIYNSLQKTGNQVLTAISYLSNKITDRGAYCLHVPAAYNDLSESVLSQNPDNVLLKSLETNELSSTLSSSLFDYLSGIALKHLS